MPARYRTGGGGPNLAVLGLWEKGDRLLRCLIGPFDDARYWLYPSLGADRLAVADETGVIEVHPLSSIGTWPVYTYSGSRHAAAQLDALAEG